MPIVKDEDGRAGWKNPGKGEAKAKPEEEKKAEAPRRKSRRKKVEEEYE